MGKNDVDTEDAEKHDPDSRDSIEGPETKVLDTTIESKDERFPSAVSAVEDSNKSDNVGEDLHKLENVTENKIAGGTEMADQMKSESKTSEPVNVDGSTGEQIHTESKNEEISNNYANVEGQTPGRSTMEEQTDARNEVVEQNNVNGRVIEESSTVNGVEGADLVKNVEENPTGDASAEKPTDGGREDGDASAVKPKETGREDGDSAAEKPEGTRRDDGDAAAEKSEGTGMEEEDSSEHVTSKEMINENAETRNDTVKNEQIPTELSLNRDPRRQNAKLDEVLKGEDVEMEDDTKGNEGNIANDKPKEQGKELLASPVIGENVRTVETATKHESHASSLPNQHEAATPSSLVLYSSAKAGDHSGETVKTIFNQAALPLMAEDDDGTPEEQAAFMKEIESFYRERAMDFKPPKFYGQPLNCLKLWRAVIRLGGYDRVTGAKLWRQVGESFHPPKTCTTVSWTFRIFYEKSLLEYEKHKRQSGELQLPVVAAPEASGADSEGSGYQGSGAGRARRDAAARAMQGWHVQRLFDNGEVGEPVIKDKNLNNMAKQKNVKSIGSLKQKRPNEAEQSVKAARTESSKQLATSVIDVGPPADWVKINIRQTKDCFEVYALVPGLLREEVRVQSDPAGRLVITGQPEQVDNAWGITPFKKVVNLPARIDPLQTSAVVSLHGRLFVRVPFEQSNA